MHPFRLATWNRKMHHELSEIRSKNSLGLELDNDDLPFGLVWTIAELRILNTYKLRKWMNFTSLNAFRVHTMFPYPRMCLPFCVFAMTMTKVRCISIENKCQSQRQSSLSNSLNWFDTMSPDSQIEKSSMKAQHIISNEVYRSADFGLKFNFIRNGEIEKTSVD